MYEWFSAVGFGGFGRRVYDALVAVSGAKPGDEVLDIGCGTGYFSRRVLSVSVGGPSGPSGWARGGDRPSPPVIDYATRRAASNCIFVLAGAEELPQPDASVDLVISSLAVHHIPPELRATALGEMFRVLWPGAAVDRRLPATTQPHRESPRRGPDRARDTKHNPIHELAGLISGAGFETTGAGDRRPLLHYVQATRPPLAADAS